MLEYPLIDPVAVEIGPLQLRWYGLMYLLGFGLAWLLARIRAGRPGSGWQPQELPDLIALLALGLILGARIGYVLFYEPWALWQDPWFLFKIWQGGMSFHGGLLGILICFYIFARKTGRKFFQVADFVAPLAPLGLAAGRIGNFLNAELWGRPSDLPWAMVFPDPAAGPVPRHPSQLYQAGLEGVALFILLWVFSAKQRPRMAVSGMFALGYGCLRFGGEFFRAPDPHLGLVLFDFLSMGQVLSIPLIILGMIMLVLAYRPKDAPRT
ncbi:MAG: prolipoprotein diacylglyceryl transferase [Desulfohalobiaceae bacterium]